MADGRFAGGLGEPADRWSPGAAGLGEVLAQLLVATARRCCRLDRQPSHRPSFVYQCAGRRIASTTKATSYVGGMLIPVRGQQLRCVGGPPPDLTADEQLCVVGKVGLHDREKLRIRSLLTRLRVVVEQRGRCVHPPGDPPRILGSTVRRCTRTSLRLGDATPPSHPRVRPLCARTPAASRPLPS